MAGAGSFQGIPSSKADDAIMKKATAVASKHATRRRKSRSPADFRL
jgi:hypothetical protein